MKACWSSDLFLRNLFFCVRRGARHYLRPAADSQLVMTLHYLVITASSSEIEREMTRLPRE